MAFDLANGHGTTRLSLEQLLERERERSCPEDYAVRKRRAAPGIGILSRTLIPSSMTKWIIPARLLGDDSMQLLFVGENYIHIKEVTPDPQLDYRLRHRKTIPFISDQIRAVSLIGQPANSQQSHSGSPLPSIYEAMAHAHMSPQEPRDFPIQIIVLALGSGFLQMLTPQCDDTSKNEYIRFKSKFIPLPTPEPHALSPGARIAVDPFSRAFAVAAAFDSVVVYNNYDSLRFAAQIAADRNNWSPIRQERIFDIPGCIVGVEFLNPGPNKDDVIMIVVTASGRKHTLSCYIWSHQGGPRHRTVIENQQLSLEPGSLCNMIIPMAHSPDFLLVHGATVNLYTDIVTGFPRVSNVVNKKSNWEKEPSHPASSKRRPHFTAWSRPERHPRHKDEFIYLIREDGAIRHYQRSRGQTAGLIGNAGNFGCSVDTAVTNFCPSHSAPDYLVGAGDLSPGELHSVGINLKAMQSQESMDRETQMSLVKQATLPDWAPVMDLQVVQSNARATIMATSGRQPFGAISELRVGYEAQVSSLADLSQLDESLVGANSMWALKDPGSDSTHYVCSYPGQTIAVFASDNGHLETSKIHWDADQSTIFAAISPEGIVILVNESGILLQRLLGAEEMEVDPATMRIRPEGPIIAACSHNNLLLGATRTPSGTSSLRLYELHPASTKLVPAGNSPGFSTTFPSDITAISMFRHLGDTFALISTRDHDLTLYKIACSSLCELAKIQLSSSITQSIQTLCNGINGVHHVLCGMRDGHLVSVELRLPARFNVSDDTSASETCSTSNRSSFGSVNYYKMGHGPVQICPDTNSAQRAFALCDNETIVIEINDEQPWIPCFTSVCFTDENDTSFRQGPLAALIVLSSLGDDNTADSDAALACHDGRNLVFARLMYERKTIPQRLPLKKYEPSLETELPPKDISGTPTKLLHSSKLDATIVAGVKYEHRPKTKVPEPAWQGKRVTRGFLLVTPSTANKGLDPNHDSWNEKATQIDFAPSERVLSVCEWSFERNGRRYHYLLVGTSIQKGEISMIEGRRQRVKKGRLWFLAPRKNDDGTIRLDLKSIKDVSRPVRALAVLDETKVAVTPDGMVCVYTFSVENKWSLVCSAQLPSPAVCITTEAPRIFITTSRSSVLGFELKQAPTVESGAPTLEQLFTDDMYRNGITHLDLAIQHNKAEPPQSYPTTSQSQRGREEGILNVLLASDKDGQIFGLEIPKHRTYQSAAPMIFELQIPQCVTKFTRGAIRAPWYERSELIAGVLEDDILGATTDGTIYHFTFLTDAARLLLKFLENLVRWDEIENQISLLCLEQQSSGEEQDMTAIVGNDEPGATVDWPVQNIVIDPEFVPTVAGQRMRRDQYGINGDLLESFLGKGAEEHLYTMLSREGNTSGQEESRYVGNQREMKWKKFCELVDRTLVSDDLVERPGMDERELSISHCTAWLREVMRPVI